MFNYPNSAIDNLFSKELDGLRENVNKRKISLEQSSGFLHYLNGDCPFFIIKPIRGDD